MNKPSGVDTIKIALKQENFKGFDFMSEMPLKLIGITEKTSSTKVRWVHGKYKNMYISVNECYMTISGSLSVYYFGNNFLMLSIADTKKAVNKLSEELGIPLYDAKLNRLDIGLNLKMDHKPSVYLKTLGNADGYRRIDYGMSLYLKNSRRILCFYDKIQQCIDEKKDIPAEFESENILRIELRYMNKLSIQLHKPQIILSDLYEPSFAKMLITEWWSEFDSIEKYRKTMLSEYNVYGSQKDYADFLMLKGIEAEGGLHKVLADIDIKNKVGMLDNTQKFRVKERIRKICSNSNLTKEDDLLSELNEKAIKIYKA